MRDQYFNFSSFLCFGILIFISAKTNQESCSNETIQESKHPLHEPCSLDDTFYFIGGCKKMGEDIYNYISFQNQWFKFQHFEKKKSSVSNYLYTNKCNEKLKVQVKNGAFFFNEAEVPTCQTRIHEYFEKEVKDAWRTEVSQCKNRLTTSFFNQNFPTWEKTQRIIHFEKTYYRERKQLDLKQIQCFRGTKIACIHSHERISFLSYGDLVLYENCVKGENCTISDGVLEKLWNGEYVSTKEFFDDPFWYIIIAFFGCYNILVTPTICVICEVMIVCGIFLYIWIKSFCKRSDHGDDPPVLYNDTYGYEDIIIYISDPCTVSDSDKSCDESEESLIEESEEESNGERESFIPSQSENIDVKEFVDFRNKEKKETSGSCFDKVNVFVESDEDDSSDEYT